MSITNSLTKEALRVFSLCGFNVWRQNNGGVYDAKIKGYRANSSTPGISDILGYHKKTGQILAVEIKTGKDKLSPAQTLFLDGIKRAGGYSFVINEISDLTEILKFYNRTIVMHNAKDKKNNSTNNLSIT